MLTSNTSTVWVEGGVQGHTVAVAQTGSDFDYPQELPSTQKADDEIAFRESNPTNLEKVCDEDRQDMSDPLDVIKRREFGTSTFE